MSHKKYHFRGWGTTWPDRQLDDGRREGKVMLSLSPKNILLTAAATPFLLGRGFKWLPPQIYLCFVPLVRFEFESNFTHRLQLRHWAEISPIGGDFSRKCCLLSFLPIPATAALRLRLTAHHSLVWGNEEFEAELTPNIEQEGIRFKMLGLEYFSPTFSEWYNYLIWFLVIFLSNQQSLQYLCGKKFWISFDWQE